MGSQPWFPCGPTGVQYPHSLSYWGSAGPVQSAGISPRPGLHSCLYATSKILAGFQKESKTWTQQHWSRLLNTLAFFLLGSLLKPGLMGWGSRLNSPLAAALEIAWQWLGVILWVRWTKDTAWQILGLDLWTLQAPKSTHSSWRAKELLRLVTRNSKRKGLSWALCFGSELGLEFFKYFGVQQLKWGQRDSHYLKFLWKLPGFSPVR